MAEPKFHLEVTTQSVYVRLDASAQSGKTRLTVLASFVGLTVLGMCALLFLPGKNGNPSRWHDLSTSPPGSADFVFPLLLMLSFPVLMLFGTKRYVKLAFPSDETFRADRSTLSVSRVRWLDVHSENWNTRSFSLTAVRDMRFQSIVNLKGGSIYGLRFVADGKTQRVLPGLKPRDAETILKALKSFGADVPDDLVLQRKLKEDLST